MLPTVCERFRAYASLELDGELAELEQVMLESHLERCADCRSYAAETSAFTRGLRTATLERPRYPVTVSPAYRRTSFRAVQAAAGATVAAVAALVALTIAPTPAPRAHQLNAATFAQTQQSTIVGARFSYERSPNLRPPTRRDSPGTLPV